MVILHLIARPKLNIMDAITGLDGGPVAVGKPIPVGALLASENAAALDIVAGRIIGYSPEEIPLLVRAKALGLLSDTGDVSVTGDVPSVPFSRLFRGPFPGARKKDSIFIKDTYVSPVVKQKKCTDCRECVAFCPAGAIERTGVRKYTVDYKKCIFCYYCMFACKEKAIGFTSTLMNKLIRFLWPIARL
jgi:ferredoxin